MSYDVIGQSGNAPNAARRSAGDPFKIGTTTNRQGESEMIQVSFQVCSAAACFNP